MTRKSRNREKRMAAMARKNRCEATPAKLSFPTWADAYRMALSVHARGVAQAVPEVYLCPTCDRFHLTTKKQKPAENEGASRAGDWQR